MGSLFTSCQLPVLPFASGVVGVIVPDTVNFQCMRSIDRECASLPISHITEPEIAPNSNAVFRPSQPRQLHFTETLKTMQFLKFNNISIKCKFRVRVSNRDGAEREDCHQWCTCQQS